MGDIPLGASSTEFFMASGHQGGLASMLLAIGIWSAVCVVTFLIARAMLALDYRTLLKHLLGPFAILFELSYFPDVVLILAVFGAAAGALGAAVFDH